MAAKRVGLMLALAAMGALTVGCASPGALSGKGYRSFAEYEHRDSPGPKPALRVAHVRVSADYPTYSVPQEQHPPRESRPYRSFSSTSPSSTAAKVFTVIGKIIGYAILGALFVALQVIAGGAGGAGGWG